MLVRNLGIVAVGVALVCGCGSEAPSGDGGDSDGDGGMAADASRGDGGARDACTPVVAPVVPSTIDLYVMLDQSGSMSEAVAGGTKWSSVGAALSTFVTGPDAARFRIGLQYFGLPGAACPTSCAVDADCGSCGPCIGGACLGTPPSSCDPHDYATPEVEVMPAAAAAPLVSASLGAHAPSTGAPTAAALSGALEHGAALAVASPAHRAVVVLITDGDPTECDTSLDAMIATAAAAATATPPVRTAVLGLGAVGFADPLAAAGGTVEALEVDLSTEVTAAVLDAMGRIPAAAGLACSYTIPAGADPASIALRYTPGTGGSTMVPRVASAAACPASGLAWHVDDPSAPTGIVLCPAACSTHLGDPAGTLETLEGC